MKKPKPKFCTFEIFMGFKKRRKPNLGFSKPFSSPGYRLPLGK